MLAVGRVEGRRALVDVAVPATRLAQVGLVVGGALVVALLAQVRAPLPFTPVPITGQTFGVLLVGALLGSRRGGLSLLLYLLLGGVGLPVFAGGGSGWPLGPTGGYVVGFILAATATGWLAERGWDRRFGSALLAMLVGQLLIYAAGVGWLSLHVGAERAVPLGLLPFLPGDAVKLMLAALALPMAWRLLGTRPSSPRSREQG